MTPTALVYSVPDTKAPDRTPITSYYVVVVRLLFTDRRTSGVPSQQ
jgi:hypothetical protein